MVVPHGQDGRASFSAAYPESCFSSMTLPTTRHPEQSDVTDPDVVIPGDVSTRISITALLLLLFGLTIILISDILVTLKISHSKILAIISDKCK